MNSQNKHYQIKRNRHSVFFLSLALLLSCFLTARAQHAEPFEGSGEKLFEMQISPLLKGMGDQQFELSNDNQLARTYFNQALVLTYGFNHLEACRH